MKVSATDVKNYFGKYLEKCKEEDILITKNDKIVARLSNYEDQAQGFLQIKEGNAAYSYTGKSIAYEDFLKIAEGNEERYEYINGMVFLLSSPGIKHQVVHANMYKQLANYFEGKKCHVFSAPFDITLLNDETKSKNVLQPDLLVSCDYIEQRDKRDRYTGVPALVIEILSPQTRSRDYVQKLNVYMQGGVSEYWVADPDEKKVIIYYFVEKQLAKMVIFNYPEAVKSLHFKGLELPAAEIFKE